jgi:hypothetical protein
VDWPGKVKSLEQLKRDWAAEEASLDTENFDWCEYGGYPEN